MIGYQPRGAAGVALAVAVTVLTGCGAPDAAGSTDTGSCPTVLSHAQGANNRYATLNGYLSGDGGGPDGFAMFSTVCLQSGEIYRLLAITVLGARPALGVSYAITDDPAAKNTAIVQYAEGNHGTKVWIGTRGVVQVDSVAQESLGLSFSELLMEPEADKDANIATGSFDLSGAQRADDVLGFVP